METPSVPKVFVSHASEDKDFFVRAFAAHLLKQGIDAWFDAWEMKPGDSLVDRIFEEGITQADVFAIVLSATSVKKPWVREELNSAVVKRIVDKDIRIIPIVLGISDEEIPASLRHLLWVPATGRDPQDVAQDVVNVAYGYSSKPPRGDSPKYFSVTPKMASNSIDEVVLRTVVDYVRSWGLNGANLQTRLIAEQLEQGGITLNALNESMRALTKSGDIVARQMMGSENWLIEKVADRVWLTIAEEQSPGIVGELRREVLLGVLNNRLGSFNPDDFDVDGFTLQAVLNQLQDEQLLTFSWVTPGGFVISNVSPLARRALD